MIPIQINNLSPIQIRRNLLSTYEEASAATIEHLQLFHDKHFYSIALEKWCSAPAETEKSDSNEFISIFVNYLDTNESNVEILRSLILNIVQGPFTQCLWTNTVESILPNISMCKGVVVNFEIDENDEFRKYLKSKGKLFLLKCRQLGAH